MILGMLRKYGFRVFFSAARQFIPSLLRQISLKVWYSWGLLNATNDIAGVGTFKLAPYAPIEALNAESIQVNNFRYDVNQHLLSAELPTGRETTNRAIAILLVDPTTLTPLPVNYTNAVKTINRGNTITVQLKLPKTITQPLHHCRAYLLVDLTPVTTIDIP
jgi:hypothetical protein